MHRRHFGETTFSFRLKWHVTLLGDYIDQILDAARDAYGTISLVINLHDLQSSFRSKFV